MDENWTKTEQSQGICNNKKEVTIGIFLPGKPEVILNYEKIFMKNKCWFPSGMILFFKINTLGMCKNDELNRISRQT